MKFIFVVQYIIIVSRKLSPSLLDGIDINPVAQPITKSIAFPVITIDDSPPVSFTPPAYYSQPSYEPLSPACFMIPSPNFQEQTNLDDCIIIDEVETSDSEDEEGMTVEEDDDNFAPKNTVDEDKIFDLELD
jgi:hypothetical protein